MRVRVVDLGLVDPIRSQSVYHAVGYTFRSDTLPTILLVSPTTPYVSIGFHQDAEREVDLDYCRSVGLPVIRREVGGGLCIWISTRFSPSGSFRASWCRFAWTSVSPGTSAP